MHLVVECCMPHGESHFIGQKTTGEFYLVKELQKIPIPCNYNDLLHYVEVKFGRIGNSFVTYLDENNRPTLQFFLLPL